MDGSDEVAQLAFVGVALGEGQLLGDVCAVGGEVDAATPVGAEDAAGVGAGQGAVDLDIAGGAEQDGAQDLGGGPGGEAQGDAGGLVMGAAVHGAGRERAQGVDLTSLQALRTDVNTALVTSGSLTSTALTSLSNQVTSPSLLASGRSLPAPQSAVAYGNFNWGRLVVAGGKIGREPFERRRESENIRFFEALNPRHAEGELLGVCVPLSLDHLLRGALRLGARRLRKALGLTKRVA